MTWLAVLAVFTQPYDGMRRLRSVEDHRGTLWVSEVSRGQLGVSIARHTRRGGRGDGRLPRQHEQHQQQRGAKLPRGRGFGTPSARLNSVSALPVTLISLKSRVYLLKDRDLVGLSVSRSVEFSKWAVLIGRTGFDTIPSIPDPTLSLTSCLTEHLQGVQDKGHGACCWRRSRRARALGACCPPREKA